MNTTALLSATYANDTAIANLLLQKGVDVNAKDVTGETPLMNAASYGNLETTRMLLAKGADVNAVSVAEGQQMKNGLLALGVMTPLLLTVAYGGPEEVKMLLDAGAKVNVQDVRGMTPLMLAVATDRADARVVKLLLAKGADTAIKSKAGETAADWAKKFSNPQILAALVIDKVQASAAPDHNVEAIIHSIAGEQRRAGNWTIAGVARPPMEDGDFSRTAICLRSLAAFPLPAREAEFNERIQRAAAWLKAASPRTTEDRSMQLLGLKWANVDRRETEDGLKKLIALQRADGGWAQTPHLTSNAYATGEGLYTIHELGVSPSDEGDSRGVPYLLRHKLA